MNPEPVERGRRTVEMKLLSSPANSTPVGPPPTTTICSSRERSFWVRAVKHQQENDRRSLLDYAQAQSHVSKSSCSVTTWKRTSGEP